MGTAGTATVNATAPVAAAGMLAWTFTCAAGACLAAPLLAPVVAGILDGLALPGTGSSRTLSLLLLAFSMAGLSRR